MKIAPPPVEFIPLNLKKEVYRKNSTEYASACPQCGGEDRFIMKLDSNATGGPLGWCRQCEWKWWPGKDDDWRPSEEELQAQAREREKALEKAIAEAQQTLEELRSARKWCEYHQGLSETAREAWKARGVDQWLIDLYELGWKQDFILWKKNGGNWEKWWKSPSLTMPIWNQERLVQNIKHRLTNPPDSHYRYRYEKRGLGSPAFYCTEESEGPLWLVEGEIKSLVLYGEIYQEGIQIAGLGSKTPSQETLEEFKDYEPIYFIPDPDAFTKPTKDKPHAAYKVVQGLGPSRVRVIRTPMKIDDMITGEMIERMDILNMRKTARRFS